jgi:hypothetical protein
VNEKGIWDTETNYVTDLGLQKGLLIIANKYNFNTFWDLGCGRGKYVKFLNDNEKIGNGIDGNLNTNYPNCSIGDLTTNLNLTKRDFTLCLEVAEHIPKQYEDIFLNNLIRSSDFLILSWAVPEQKGIGHVNSKRNTDVINLMLLRGYKFLPKESYYLRQFPINWYFKKSLLIFTK